MPEVPKLLEPLMVGLTPTAEAAWMAQCVEEDRRERAYTGQGDLFVEAALTKPNIALSCANEERCRSEAVREGLERGC